MQLHINRDGQQFGPYELAQVNEMLAQGSLLPTDYAWHEGTADWIPLSQVSGIVMPGAAPTPQAAIPVATEATMGTETQSTVVDTANAAKKKKILLIGGISVAGVGAVVGALFAFGVLGGGGEEPAEGDSSKNGSESDGSGGNDGSGKMLPPAAAKLVTYTGDIKPILEGNCFKCHGMDKTKKPKGGLDMSKENDVWEGKGGKVLIPGNSAESPILEWLTNPKDPMPPAGKGKMLNSEEVGLIRKWIDLGAKFD